MKLELKMKNLDMKLALFCAFIGNITKNIISITYEYVDYEIIIYATTELDPSDEDYEGIDIAITELMSSQPDIKQQNINIEKFNGIIGEISPHSGFIFLRKLN